LFTLSAIEGPFNIALDKVGPLSQKG